MVIIKLFLLVCCCPSLCLAWCSGGVGIGSRAIARADANPHPLRPRSPSARRHCAARGVRLRARPEEATSDSEGDKGSGDKMTLQKATKLLATFRDMAAPYYLESQPGRRLFYGMVALCLLNSAVSVQFSYIGKDFYNALNGKDAEEFYKMMIKFGGALLVGAPVSVLFRFQREQLAVAWREWMTDRALQLYSSNRVYYSLERDIASSAEASPELSTQADGKPPASDKGDAGQTAARIDNPDQRLTEDVRKSRRSRKVGEIIPPLCFILGRWAQSARSLTVPSTPAARASVRNKFAKINCIFKCSLKYSLQRRHLHRLQPPALYHSHHLHHRSRILLCHFILHPARALRNHHRLRYLWYRDYELHWQFPPAA